MAYQISHQQNLANNRRTIRWIFFLIFVHTVPSIWFLGAAAGLAPTSVLLAVGLSVPFFSLGGNSFFLLFILLPSLIYCLLYYGIAYLLSILLGKLNSRLLQTVLVSLVVISLLIMAFYPIYSSGGHGSTSYHSIVGLWQAIDQPINWLYAYTLFFGLIQSGLLVTLYRGGSIPAFSISAIWGNRRARTLVMVCSLAIVVSILYVNRVALVCRPLGNMGIARAQVCIAQALLNSNRHGYQTKQKAMIWFERAALQGNTEAAWALIKNSKNATDRNHWLILAAENGDGKAQYELFVLSLRSDKTDQDRLIGSKWLQSAAENGESRAQYELSRRYLGNSSLTDRSKDITQSRYWLEMAADQEHPQAMRTTAYNYENGTFGFPLNLKKAKSFYQEFVDISQHEATNQYAGLDEALSRIEKISQLQNQLDDNNLQALINLAFKHLDAIDPGPGVRDRGMELLQAAAEQGDLSAQYKLGAIYLRGKYAIPKDFIQGRKWWKKAAEGHHIKAMEDIARGYTSGSNSFEIDHTKAKRQIEILIKTYRNGLYTASIDESKSRYWQSQLKYITRAMEQAGGEYIAKDILRQKTQANDSKAQYQLAKQLMSESSIRNGQEAFDLYKKAAASGHSEAQFALFRLHQQGLSYTSSDMPGRVNVIVKKSNSQSAHYLKQAANEHHPQAMASLALAYEKGRYGLEKDYVKARELYEAIIIAFENNSYHWDVNKYFVDFQRSRLKIVTSALEYRKER